MGSLINDVYRFFDNHFCVVNGLEAQRTSNVEIYKNLNDLVLWYFKMSTLTQRSWVRNSRG